MSDCERAVEKVRRLDRLAKSETGLSSIPSADEEVMSKCSAYLIFIVVLEIALTFVILKILVLYVRCKP